MDEMNIAQTPVQKAHNPLANYFRQPKVYIKLPSQGNFYPKDSLDRSANDEYAVYAMTAKDELMFKTPDALMNGSATVEVIKSCVPSITNPWDMPSIDLDAILIAIRIATYGDEMEVSTGCPACSSVNDYSVNLTPYLDHAQNFQYNNTVTVGPLVIHLRPYTYKEVTKTAIKTIEQQKIFNIVNDDSISDEDKLEKFGESFVKLTSLTVDVITGCIDKIETPDGIVTDKVMIREFINNSDGEVFRKISDRINQLKDELSLKASNVKCGECEHEFGIELSMDQANFFALGS